MTSDQPQSHVQTQPNILKMMAISAKHAGNISAGKNEDQMSSMHGTRLSNTLNLKVKEMSGSSLFKTTDIKNSQLNTARN